MIPKFRNGKFEIRFHQHERTTLSKAAELTRVLSKMQPIDPYLSENAAVAADALEALLGGEEEKEEESPAA